MTENTYMTEMCLIGVNSKIFSTPLSPEPYTPIYIYIYIYEKIIYKKKLLNNNEWLLLLLFIIIIQ